MKIVIYTGFIIYTITCLMGLYVANWEFYPAIPTISERGIQVLKIMMYLIYLGLGCSLVAALMAIYKLVKTTLRGDNS